MKWYKETIYKLELSRDEAQVLYYLTQHPTIDETAKFRAIRESINSAMWGSTQEVD